MERLKRRTQSDREGVAAVKSIRTFAASPPSIFPGQVQELWHLGVAADLPASDK